MSHYDVGIARLRGACTLVVMCMHYKAFFHFPFAVPAIAVNNGYYGVTAFFVVSGFLITRTIESRYGTLANVSLKGFYVMRAARILPALALLIVILSLLSFSSLKQFWLKPPLSLPDTLWYVVTLRYNLFYAFEGGKSAIAWSVLWSLAIEEAFYVGYPLLLKAAGRISTLVLALALIVVLGPIVRAGSVRLTGLYLYSGCFDAIAMGALAALAMRCFQSCSIAVIRGLMIFGLALLTSVYLSLDVHVHYVVGPLLIAIGACAVLIASVASPATVRRSSWCDWLAHMGRRSYELYLFHMTGFLLAAGALQGLACAPILPFCIIFALIFFICILIGDFYAGPLNRYVRSSFAPKTRVSSGSGDEKSVVLLEC